MNGLAVKREKVSVGMFLQQLADCKAKGAIVLLFTLISLACLLFMPFVSRTEVIFEIDLTGLDMANTLLSGGQFGYVFAGQTYMFELPAVYGVVYFALLVLVIALFAAVLIVNFIKKKDVKWMGYLYLTVGLLSFAAFTLMTGLGGGTVDIYGGTVPLHQAFAPGSVLLINAVLLTGAGLIQSFLRLNKLKKVKRYWFIYLLLAPSLVYIMIFEVYPLFLQIILAFKDYRLDRGVWGSSWYGFQNFVNIFSDASVYGAILNTFYLSFLFMLTGVFPSLIFAVMLFEIKSNTVRKVVQSISYIPHFFSWVIIYAIVYALLGNTGVVNSLLVRLGVSRVEFFANERAFLPLILITDLWKGLGWGTIIFLAALSGVDQSLYDAAAVDGAGPIHKLTRITLPAISPVFLFILIMNIGNLLKGVNGEQLLLFSTPITQDRATVIGTWLYWEGLSGMKYGLGAAMSFFQSVVGFLMVLGSNFLSKRWLGRSII